MICSSILFKNVASAKGTGDSYAFHAGTTLEGGIVKSNGGRVLAISSVKDTQFEALQSATADAARIYFDGKYFREDIGFDLI